MKFSFWLLLISLFFTGCLHAVYFTIHMAEPSNTIKTHFPAGKVVQWFSEMPYHGGSVAIFNDFSFEREIIVSLSEACISYQGSKWKLHFIGNDLRKDSIHVDGDENLSTLFTIPSWYQFGDTLTISFDGFLKDRDGNEYNLKPVFLVLNKRSGTR